MILKDHRAIGAGAVGRPPIKFDGPLGGLEHASGDVQQRALPAAAGAYNDDKLARLTGQADIVQRLHGRAGEIDVDAVENEFPARRPGRDPGSCREGTPTAASASECIASADMGAGRLSGSSGVVAMAGIGMVIFIRERLCS